MGPEEVVVEAVVHWERRLRLDEATGQWRLCSELRLPDTTALPPAPAFLAAVDGRPCEPDNLRAILADTSRPHRLTFRLAQVSSHKSLASPSVDEASEDRHIHQPQASPERAKSEAAPFNFASIAVATPPSPVNHPEPHRTTSPSEEEKISHSEESHEHRPELDSPVAGGTTTAALLPPKPAYARRRGHVYLSQEVDTERGPMGLRLETLGNRVAIVEIRAGTQGAELFKLWDVLVAVDGIRVSEARVAKALIHERGGKFAALVERGSEAAAAEMARAFEAARKVARLASHHHHHHHSAVAQLPRDAQDFAAAAAAKVKTAKPRAPALRPTKAPPRSKPSVSFAAAPIVTPIPSDLRHNVPLRKTPKL